MMKRKILSAALAVLVLLTLSVPVLALTFDDGDLPIIYNLSDFMISETDNGDGTITKVFNTNVEHYHYLQDSVYSSGNSLFSTVSSSTFSCYVYPIRNKYVYNDGTNKRLFNSGNEWLYIGDLIKSDNCSFEFSFEYSIECSDTSVKAYSSFQIISFYDEDFNLISKISGETTSSASGSNGVFSGNRSKIIAIPDGTYYIHSPVFFMVSNLDVGSTIELDVDLTCTVTDINWNYETSPSFTPGLTLDYSLGESPLSLGLNASTNAGTFSYQWYTGADKTALTPIDGATGNIFTPPTDSVGEFHYWGATTFSYNGQSKTLYDGPVIVTVTESPPETPTVSSPNDSSYDYVIGNELPQLSVNINASEDSNITYQWFIGSDLSSGSPIPGATYSSYTPELPTEGTWYFWCEVTNTNSAGSVSVLSDPVKISARNPTLDDIWFSWGSSPIEILKGSSYSLSLFVPPSLFDSYTLQWYEKVDSLWNTRIDGATGSSYAVSSDVVGVTRYTVCINYVMDGKSGILWSDPAKVMVVDESYSEVSRDEELGISWNWGDDPIRLNLNQYKLLQVIIPEGLDVHVIQWYVADKNGDPVAIEGENDPFFTVPSDEVGVYKYTCAVVLNDGTGFSATADITVLEDESFESGGSGAGDPGISGDSFFNGNSKNNLDLVEWVVQAYNNGWGYVMGTYGQVLTQELYEYKLSQYPDAVSPFADFIQANYIGRRTADCVGLIKGYCWYDPSTGEIVYGTNDCPDYSADQLYEFCIEKGQITNMPEIPGLIVWKSGHVGVYIGNGYVIEARGTKAGVIKSHIDDLAWTNWAKLPCITYVDSSSGGSTETPGDDDGIINSLGGIWEAIKNLPGMILDGIIGLFVPSEEDMVEYADKWDALLASRFGAVWESMSFASGLVDIIYNEVQPIITVPSVTVDLAGTDFTFGGWEVRVIPEGFEFLVDYSKLAVNIVATLAFVGGLRKRLAELLGISMQISDGGHQIDYPDLPDQVLLPPGRG